MSLRLKSHFVLLMALLPLLATAAENGECVILLHGLCRSSRSMIPMEKALTQAGYRVLNVDYPSRTALIDQLSEATLPAALNTCREAQPKAIHFVTHSLGSLLVRSYLAHHDLANLGRVVMLGPPNQGSELVDQLGSSWLFQKLNGPAGNEMGTDLSSPPTVLGPANFPLGVIAGNRSINWLNSLMIPGRDDGKVAVARTQLVGMTEHVTINSAHPFLMRNPTAIRHTINFLQTGHFNSSGPHQI